MSVDDGARPLFGRDEPFATLLAAYQEVAAGHARFVEVIGDPGIGKSHLLAAFAQRAEARGALVLWASARSLGREVAFGAVHDALDELNTELISSSLDEEAEFALQAHAAARALRRQLKERHSGQPIVMVLDDLHAADDCSLHLLGELIRRPPRSPLLVVMAYRPRQASALLASALTRTGRPVQRLSLEPLDQQAAQLLVGRESVLPYALSGGNPLHLTALAAGQPETGDPGTALPPGARAELTRDLADVSPATHAVAEVAAVAAVGGETFDIDMVTAASGLDREAVLTALQELIEVDLIRPARRPAEFAFRHPLVQQAIYEATGVGRRLRIHQRAADELAHRSAPPKALAGHVEHLADRTDPSSARLLAEAGEAMVPQNPRVAARWLSLAARLTSAGNDDEARQGLLLRQADASARAGRLADSYTTLHELLRLVPEPGPQRLRVIRMCAMVERLLGRHAEARQLLSDEFARLPGRAENATLPLAELEVELAAACLQAADATPASAPDIGRSVEIFRRHRQRPLDAAGRALAGLLSVGDAPHEFSRYVDDGARLIDQIPDVELADRLELLSLLDWIELRLERYGDAKRHGERAAEIARATGQVVMLGQSLTALGSALGWIGNLAGAERSLAEAAATLSTVDSDYLRAITLAERCWLRLRANDVTGAVRFGEQAVEAARSAQGWVAPSAPLRLAMARLRAGGAPEIYVREFLRAAGGPELSAVPPLHRAEFYEPLIDVALLGGNGKAADWSARIERDFTEIGLDGHAAAGRLAQARAAAAAGDTETAAALARRAADGFERVGNRHDAGRARQSAAAAFAELGRPEDATEQARQAQELLESVGGRLRQVDSERPPPESSPTLLERLTQREREISGLVSKGATNGQIARRLQLSEKTIEGHLTRIFNKLGLSSRAALAGALAGALAAVEGEADRSAGLSHTGH